MIGDAHPCQKDGGLRALPTIADFGKIIYFWGFWGWIRLIVTGGMTRGRKFLIFNFQFLMNLIIMNFELI